MLNSSKLNVGCGNDIRKDSLNLDIAVLPGVDVVHDINLFPWPFEENTFEEVFMINVLEHLPDTVKAIEELFRISKEECIIHIRVPYWNSYISYGDPTHLKTFHQDSFDFFDPNTVLGKRRYYYSKAKFQILKKYYWIRFKFGRKEKYFKVGNPLLKKILETLSLHLCNIIYLLELDCRVLKKTGI